MAGAALINYPATSKLPLDVYPNAEAAYSLRKLLSTYTGSAIRVRRDSDNAEQDIGFSGINLNASALSTFCSGANGFITMWYDQSGNGRDYDQPTAARQMRIITSAGVIDSNNGKYSAKGTSDWYRVTNWDTTNIDVYIIGCGVTTLGTIIGNSYLASTAAFSFLLYQDANITNSALGAAAVDGLYANNSIIGTLRDDVHDAFVGANNILLSLEKYRSTAVGGQGFGLQIGAGGNGGNIFNGYNYFSELIAWPNDATKFAERGDFINTYYNAY